MLELLVKLFKNPELFLYRLRKAWMVLRASGISGLLSRIFHKNGEYGDYSAWVKDNDTLADDDRTKILRHISNFKVNPKISILMPTFNTKEELLRASIESVINQIYQNWELCVVDDNSSNPRVRDVIKEYAARDPRICYSFQSDSKHIAETTNSAARLATGVFLGFLDHDDELSDKALYLVASEINRFPNSDLIYSDEDKIDESGNRLNPFFKPDWNPELLLSQNYICHFTVIRRSIFERVEGFRTGLDGAQDWDLVLRVSEVIEHSNIRHIPHILYHWRMTSGSTALTAGAKPYVARAQLQVVKDHLSRVGDATASVEMSKVLSTVRVRRVLQDPLPHVSLIIPTKDKVELLSRCIGGILEKTRYDKLEVLVVDNGSESKETKDYLELISKDPRVVVFKDGGPFNYSRLNNNAARIAKGEILGFLNNDLEITDSEWLSEMVTHAVRPQVGAVGARLLYPDGTLQHGGVVLGIGGVAGHELRGIKKYDPGYFNRAMLTRNVSAVTAACMLMRKSIFDEVGGFNEENLAVAFNDVDLCLKVRKKGYLIVYTPHAELYHHESASRGSENTLKKLARFDKEIETMKRTWGEELDNDPYYNPNLTIIWEDFSLASPSRARKPWLEIMPE